MNCSVECRNGDEMHDTCSVILSAGLVFVVVGLAERTVAQVLARRVLRRRLPSAAVV